MARTRNHVTFGEWFGIGLVGLAAVLGLVCAVIAFVSGAGFWVVVFLLEVALATGMAVAMVRESMYG